jgi:hypothetical protein
MYNYQRVSKSLNKSCKLRFYFFWKIMLWVLLLQSLKMQYFSNYVLRHDLTLYLSQADYLIRNRHMRDFRLPPRCKWDLPSFGILRSVESQKSVDVSKRYSSDVCGWGCSGFLARGSIKIDPSDCKLTKKGTVPGQVCVMRDIKSEDCHSLT